MTHLQSSPTLERPETETDPNQPKQYTQTATLYRMVTPEHICPWGLKAKDILERKGFEIDDRHLKTMDENEAFKKKREVSETPQIYVEGEHIGGYEDLRSYLGMEPEEKSGTTYQPVIAIFAVAFLMALSTSLAGVGPLVSVHTIELFIAYSMCILAIMKLRDLSTFTTQFLSYDLVSRKSLRYAYSYPFLEAGAGILMVGGLLPLLSGPVAFVIGTLGAISVFKAVYIDKRELECACVGGGSSVPLGFVSLTENLMMIAMGAWVLIKLAL